jgi:hypothetical protein
MSEPSTTLSRASSSLVAIWAPSWERLMATATPDTLGPVLGQIFEAAAAPSRAGYLSGVSFRHS